MWWYSTHCNTLQRNVDAISFIVLSILLHRFCNVTTVPVWKTVSKLHVLKAKPDEMIPTYQILWTAIQESSTEEALGNMLYFAKGTMKREKDFQNTTLSCLQILGCAKLFQIVQTISNTSNVWLTWWVQNWKFEQSTVGTLFSKPAIWKRVHP